MYILHNNTNICSSSLFEQNPTENITFRDAFPIASPIGITFKKIIIIRVINIIRYITKALIIDSISIDSLFVRK